MSRLSAVTESLDEIGAQFAVDMASALVVPSETDEGTPGLIVLEKDGLRLLKSFPWGFPGETREMRREGEPPGRIGFLTSINWPNWNMFGIGSPIFLSSLPRNQTTCGRGLERGIGGLLKSANGFYDLVVTDKRRNSLVK